MLASTDDDTRFFFFFQAEDGIRDVAVTGVQTCALPIFIHKPASASPISMILLARITFSKRESRKRLNCTATKPVSLNTLITHFLLALLTSLFSPCNYTSSPFKRQGSHRECRGDKVPSAGVRGAPAKLFF